MLEFDSTESMVSTLNLAETNALKIQTTGTVFERSGTQSKKKTPKAELTNNSAHDHANSRQRRHSIFLSRSRSLYRALPVLSDNTVEKDNAKEVAGTGVS